MNSISFPIEADPHDADGVIRTRFDGERLIGFDAFEGVVRIVFVGWIFRDRGTLRVPDGAGFSVLPAVIGNTANTEPVLSNALSV